MVLLHGSLVTTGWSQATYVGLCEHKNLQKLMHYEISTARQSLLALQPPIRTRQASPIYNHSPAVAASPAWSAAALEALKDETDKIAM